MREPTTHPDGLDRLPVARAVLVLVLATVVATQCGCGGGAIANVAGAVKTTLDVLRQTRAVLCVPALDPLMGDPREGHTTWIPKTPADAGTDAGD